uniref:Uncharacterized protein n=1 Tax=Arion vulgaris TaxID=1028688 RepID=A0A0B7ACH6_9EUPU
MPPQPPPSLDILPPLRLDMLQHLPRLGMPPARLDMPAPHRLTLFGTRPTLVSQVRQVISLRLQDNCRGTTAVKFMGSNKQQQWQSTKVQHNQHMPCQLMTPKQWLWLVTPLMPMPPKVTTVSDREQLVCLMQLMEHMVPKIHLHMVPPARQATLRLHTALFSIPLALHEKYKCEISQVGPYVLKHTDSSQD